MDKFIPVVVIKELLGGENVTIADWIRNMTDEELAAFLTAIISERDHVMFEKLAEPGVPNSLIEIPAISIARHLEYLQRPFEKEVDNL